MGACVDPRAPPEGRVTALLAAWCDGDPAARERLLPLVYDDLRRAARRRLGREGRAHTLSATALVHEAYLRLVGQRSSRWESRAQFLAVASEVMRRVLVDHARRRLAAKRGGGRAGVTLEPSPAVAEREVDVLALDLALRELAGLDPRSARVVELRFFGGLSIEEAASALGVSHATVEREWTAARAWLYRRLRADAAGAAPR
jgi:RNA polymerase sigma factor (TIGR02999 family)